MIADYLKQLNDLERMSNSAPKAQRNAQRRRERRNRKSGCEKTRALANLTRASSTITLLFQNAGLESSNTQRALDEHPIHVTNGSYPGVLVVSNELTKLIHVCLLREIHEVSQAM